VQGTPGAELHPDLERGPIEEIVQKGTDMTTDAYSGFLGTDLADRLRRRHILRVYVAGLATDYCVKNTALDAVREGFQTAVLTDACRAVEVRPGDGEAALRELELAGARLLTSNSVH
jgi:nicotinamidase/pyrazinamidase